MSMAWGAPHLTDGPSVRHQVVRATVGTFTVVAVVAALIAAFVYGAGPAASLWWRIAGDPAVTLADAVVLSDVPPTTTVPVVAARVWSLDQDLAALSAPLGGGDASVVTSSEELAALAPYFASGSGLPDQRLAEPVAVLPSGVLTVVPAFEGWNGHVAFHGGPSAPVAVTQQAQAALALELVTTWGLGDLEGTGFAARAVLSPRSAQEPSDGSASYGIEITGTSCVECVITSYDQVSFDAQGRLTFAVVETGQVTGTAPVEVPSAAQAFDDLRHHRGEAYLGDPTVPVVEARLSVAETGTPNSVPQWLFYDASGQPAGLLILPSIG